MLNYLTGNPRKIEKYICKNKKRIPSKTGEVRIRNQKCALLLIAKLACRNLDKVLEQGQHEAAMLDMEHVRVRASVVELEQV